MTFKWRDSTCIRINSIPTRVMQFPGGELNVDINDSCGYINEVSVTFLNPQDIIEFMLVCDAIERESPNSLKYSGLDIGYFPYTRQDRVCNRGEALSIKMMTDIINQYNFEEVRIYDPHSDVTPALINKCVIKYQDSLLEEVFYRNSEDDDYNLLIAPDAGAEKKMKDFGRNYIVANKVRDCETGEIIKTRLNDTIPDNSKVLIVDDICDGGRTFIELAKVIKNQSETISIDLFVTHGIFSKGFGVFSGLIDKIYYCNTRWQMPDKDFEHIIEKEILNVY